MTTTKSDTATRPTTHHNDQVEEIRIPNGSWMIHLYESQQRVHLVFVGGARKRVL